jgi:hypothetical protein
MAKILLSAALLVAIATGAAADNATTTFTDPTEQAFSYQVPKNWQVKGGIVRNSALDARMWISVSTGDRSTVMFIGDPSIPAFAERSGNGSGRSFALPQGVVEAPYENGQQFAADYGNKVLPHVCNNVQLKGTQPNPELAQKVSAQAARVQQEMGTNFPQPQVDGGSAMFICQGQGRTLAARIVAATVVTPGPMGRSWRVANIGGFTTPAALEGKAQAIFAAMSDSMNWNPDWRAHMAEAARQKMAQDNQNAAQWQQVISANAAAGSRMLYNQYQSNMYRSEVNHNAFMQQMNSQRDSRNAAFAQHMYQKSVGQQNEMMYIQNQQCIHRVYNQPGNACNVYVQH